MIRLEDMFFMLMGLTCVSFAFVPSYCQVVMRWFHLLVILFVNILLVRFIICNIWKKCCLASPVFCWLAISNINMSLYVFVLTQLEISSADFSGSYLIGNLELSGTTWSASFVVIPIYSYFLICGLIWSCMDNDGW